jgi:hypothetical protein
MLSIFARNFLPKVTRPEEYLHRPTPSHQLMKRYLWCLNLSLMGVVIAGCGKSSTSGVTANPITMANANGLTSPAVALSIGSKLNLSMMPSNDVINAGVDWTVTCRGNPTTGIFTNGACGTLTPAHTTDGGVAVFTAPSVTPIGTTVTITATITSNPSQASSVTFTILPTPITLSFFNKLPPTSLAVNTTALLAAMATNDPLGTGEIWTASCGSPECGSFSSTTTDASGLVPTTYTAPATVPTGGTVTIRATSLTDTTKSINATLTITGPPPPPPPPPPPATVAVSVLPAVAYVQRTGASRSAQLTAIVSNDSTAAGVDWSLSCGTSNCGAISGHTSSGGAATFNNTSTVPVGGTITITAKSTIDPTKLSTATATVVTNVPAGVTIAPALPAHMNTDTQVTLAAAASPGTDGVNWTATCGSAGACGSFNLSPAHTTNSGQIIYTAPSTVPSGSVVTITASFAGTASANPAFSTTTIVQAPPPTPMLTFASPAPATLVSVTQFPLAVSVTNDIAPGGVTWTAQCGNTAPGGCGWFAPRQTASGVTTIYTAPPVTSTGTIVTVTATSIADPSVSISSNPITIAPDTTLKVSFIPSLPSQMQGDATVNLNAAVANDPSHAGVDWQVCSSGCGFFTIKPAVSAIQQTATTPYVPAVAAVTATTVPAWPNGLSIPYTAPSQTPSTGVVSVTVSAHVDMSTANSGTIAISPMLNGPELHGIVQAGTQPVVGAGVALYAAGASGYGSLSTQLASSLATDSGGSFKIDGTYSCPQPDSQIYVVAIGGKVGKSNANTNLALITALGSCNSLSSSSFAMNEVTTVASAFALAPFAADDALTGNSSYLYIGTSSSNRIGLSNAFAAVNNLVDISTGKVRFTVPAENAAVPYVEINTLADSLNACAVTEGGAVGDGSVCGSLFEAASALSAGDFGSGIPPSDTLQAAFNIAQHPVANYGYKTNVAGLFGLASSALPFQPILGSAPNDWSVSLNYTRGGGLSSTSAVGSFAVDATGNLWITDTKAASIIEWNAVGAALSPPAGFPAGGGPIAIDATGNVWISGDGVLTELTSLGSPLPWSPFGGVSGGGGDMAFDAQSNLWITNFNSINEFSGLGLQLSPVSGFTVDDINKLTAVAIDSANNVWFGTGPNGQASNGQIVELTNPGGLLISSGNTGSTAAQMAADSAGDIWFIGAASVCEASPYGGKGSTLLPNCTQDGGGGGTSGFLDTYDARGIALDGAGTVWVAGSGGGSNTVPPGVLPIIPSGSPPSAVPYVSSSLASGSLRVAVDGSGNIWVLLANNTVTEYVGAATPVVTPLALGVQNKKLGAKP